MTITEFLLARIAEDEADARSAALSANEPDWIFHESNHAWEIAGTTEHEDSTGYRWRESVTRDSEGLSDSVEVSAGPHIARHDPARVLRECAAKRAVIESVDTLTGGEKTHMERLRLRDAEDARYVIARDMLRHLAAVYADHPDYDEAWRP